jgi:hypothetical protein
MGTFARLAVNNSHLSRELGLCPSQPVRAPTCLESGLNAAAPGLVFALVH